ncbi:ankyrin repeat domain-containing protein 2 isoform X2 [Hemicordylus capensis]|uniref:ankyrin repeat domain-containing protein 2 isoform X2 n=1 Tax=Hemicordylus capensis TaxID=884348 RepID=UPI00230222A6|nr:ankyrin repeat domain-containing protein 2 isoform X2 [Hemicordylus capensis]
MTTDQGVKWATELIEQKLALEEEQKLHSCPPAMLPEVSRVDTPHLEDEKKHGPINKGIEGLKGQERVRKTSVDLRREIIEVGGTQYLFELRKKPKKKKEEKAPEPEPEEITGPVAEEDFLKAAVQGKVRVVEKFLTDGNSPDTCDELDSTAMHWACRGGHLDVVKLLQEKGANLNVKDKLLSTPLHVATRTGMAEIVEHLINNGVDVNSCDREGDTALHDAVRLNRYKIIKMLILHGADMMAKNLAGKTPTDLVQLWQADTREVLEKQEEPKMTEMPA